MAMTEITFSRNISPDVKRFQLDGSSADKATQVNIPNWCRRITIRPEGHKARLSFTSSSDNINDDFIKLSANSPSEIEIVSGEGKDNRVNKLYIANITGRVGQFVSVLVEGKTTR
ncbi:MAG: hypothetical protein Unbinned4118contig1001_30 [Prokaryotic dsDNA virus sp.]|jgi:hypothetical protein|nr:MAG: hypothetical protein Unbinned4118contig1001_30 [Prokaryotic dsDNA virus sp.]|tara:strand:+ start:5211 stop:5555 length:345 start_codon:yes stop_codon:yes gene_type:complete